MSATFEIKGYIAVLPHIQNVYPVEKEEFYWGWGFKYCSGVFEFFSYETEKKALVVHNKFVSAINQYYKLINQK